MKITDKNLPNLFLIILYILSGLFVYWGLVQLEDLLINISRILAHLLKATIYFPLLVGLVFEGLILIGLLFLIYKAIRFKINKLQDIKPSFELSKLNLKKLGIIVLILTAINILASLFAFTYLENDINVYLEENLFTLDSGIAYMQFVAGIMNFLQKVLIFTLYFLIIRKLANSKGPIKQRKEKQVKPVSYKPVG